LLELSSEQEEILFYFSHKEDMPCYELDYIRLFHTPLFFAGCQQQHQIEKPSVGGSTPDYATDAAKLDIIFGVRVFFFCK
jgi:hypothetical protein